MIDISKYKKIYDDLLKYNIELNYEDIPSPSYIQQKIIQCNNYQHAVERYFIEVTRDLALAERMYSIEKLNLETLKRSILTTNEEIKKIATGREREAAVDGLLENKYKELLKLENDVNELKSLLSAIKQKQATLKNVNSDIKALIKLMDNMVNKLNIGSPTDPEIKKLNEIYKNIEELEKENEKIEDIEDDIESSIDEEDNKKDDIVNMILEDDPEKESDDKNKLDKPFVLTIDEDYSSNIVFDSSLTKEPSNIHIFSEQIDSSSIKSSSTQKDKIYSKGIEESFTGDVFETNIEFSEIMNIDVKDSKLSELKEEKNDTDEEDNFDNLLDSFTSILN